MRHDSKTLGKLVDDIFIIVVWKHGLLDASLLVVFWSNVLKLFELLEIVL